MRKAICADFDGDQMTVHVSSSLEAQAEARLLINYHQLLPIIAEKVHQEKVQQEKLKAVKARLNFEEDSQHSESGAPRKMGELRKRHRSRRVRSGSESPELRRRRPESPMKKDLERKIVFKRLEKGAFYRLKDKGKSSSKSRTLDNANMVPHVQLHAYQIRQEWETVACNHRIKAKHQEGSAKSKQKGETSSKDKALAILMVQLWQRVARQRITQSFSPNPEISFPSLEEEECIEGLMIIEAESRAISYTEYGSGHCPLIEFSGKIIWPLGKLSLLVKIRDEEHSTLAWMNFVVVRSPSPYNKIIKRPIVRKVQAVSLTAHGMLKFPVARGAIEERIKVAINPDYLEQTIMIGSTLIEEERNKLCDLLQHNLDVFAWKPADMTGVLRHVAEHRLNIREGCPPVRQKRRSQAADRNQAIQEEVEKLVNASIMKEVHYHSWLSNPVMVKKHDNSWRMCADFKDLNKACPKDGYPLSKIDWKMAKEDKEKTTFITSQWVFCYSKMPFSLRNAGAIYQRLVDKAFYKQIGRNLELIAELPTLTAPEEKEKLIVYLAAAKEAVNTVLMTKMEAKQMPIYFVSRALRADFIVERPEENDPDTTTEVEEELLKPLILFTDRSSCADSSEARLILTYSEGAEFTYILSFMMFSIKQVPRSENKKVDALSKIASTSFAHLSKQLLVEELKEKSINELEVFVIAEEEGNIWMTPIYEYLTEETLPAEVNKAKAVWHNPFKDWCEKLCIHQRFASVKHPQENGLVKRANRSLGEGFKARLDTKSKNWMEEISHVLLAHRTMIKSSNGDTLFSLTYGTEAVIPAEIRMPTLRKTNVDMVQNNEALGINLDLLEERKEHATIREAKSKAKMEKYYNSKVCNISFKP
nr:reverse transcriptase domain-containing protein [Tanacetum cinerariifolium]